MRLAMFRRTPTLAVGLVSVAVLVALVALGPGGSGPASAAPSGCPNSNALGNFKTATNVAASFSNSGTTTTYTFASLTNQNPKEGVPGLIDYCVYPTPTTPPTATTVTATGADGTKWTVDVKKPPAFNSFAFSRPAGDKTNIPLDGKTTTMGTATWATVPTQQIILLHINDPAVCGNSGTCFVKPAANLASVCDKGDTTLAYNANSFGAVNCYSAALGFEAQATNEFGDGVGLAGTARGLASLDVLFASFGCGTSGHWNTGDCVTTPGATFPVPVTAKIYDINNLGTPITSVTQTFNIPFRPSADTTGHCTNADPNSGTYKGKWFNPDGGPGLSGSLPGGGRCQNSIGTILTFTNFSPAVTLPNQVVWTVAFNTTHYGYQPIGQSAACFSSPPGCGYDSLNVGAWSFPSAPYAGTDLSEDTAYQSTGQPPSALHAVTGFTGFRPDGAIRTQ